jgi:hypothetical protein
MCLYCRILKLGQVEFFKQKIFYIAGLHQNNLTG